jgi:pantothenate kinase
MPPTFDDLLIRARSLAREGRRAVLGIAGAPGSGKTTLAGRLVAELNGTGAVWVAHVPMDGFHLADVELDRLGLRDRKGAPETFDAAGYAALLRRLRERTPSGEREEPAVDGRGNGAEEDIVYAPGFERVLEQPLAGVIPVLPSVRLVVTEGNYLLLGGPGHDVWTRVRRELDEVWFCEVPEAERVRRLVARHEEFGKDHAAALAWTLGPDGRNARLVAATRDRAALVVPADTVPAGTPRA